ncbi:hypothetical protein DEU56DRAFT_597730 [Suillus clintonianus]|uniref:uncharacterized protein n=1 Tax=Suillus clintonianus TaxID=1904413 RepID=UPI001B87C3C4|nr:uncharacterized protein DEU56DRAFT_597730 [Suillus clintonianus]KAG2124228.1 hypothetical protein DEU56DRAFT_597730 [Suillus clintonianus]
MDTSAFKIQFIGLTISFVQLGVAVAQGFSYHRTFPRDKRLLKYLVVTVLTLNTAATLLTSFMYWSFFSNCFRSKSPKCQAWDTASMVLLFVAYTVPFIVQSFYCHRVWIISDKNIYVTIPIVLLAASSYALGLVLIPSQKSGAFASNAMLKISTAGTFQSVVCDSMISLSVYFYLRPGRSGVRRTDTRIRSITKNFISMGFLTCLLAFSICILYWANSFAAIGGVAMVLRNSYANSVLAILNARKPLARHQSLEIELPTITVRGSR